MDRPDLPAIHRRWKRISARNIKVVEKPDQTGYNLVVDGVAFSIATVERFEDAEFFAEAVRDVEALLAYVVFLESQGRKLVDHAFWGNSPFQTGPNLLASPACHLPPEWFQRITSPEALAAAGVPGFGENGGRVGCDPGAPEEDRIVISFRVVVGGDITVEGESAP